jgi:hypothetical protein
MYASGWFLTIYITGFPFEFSLRVFDCFFDEGEKVLFRIGLGFLASIKGIGKIPFLFLILIVFL